MQRHELDGGRKMSAEVSLLAPNGDAVVIYPDHVAMLQSAGMRNGIPLTMVKTDGGDQIVQGHLKDVAAALSGDAAWKG